MTTFRFNLANHFKKPVLARVFCRWPPGTLGFGWQTLT